MLKFFLMLLFTQLIAVGDCCDRMIMGTDNSWLVMFQDPKNLGNMRNEAVNEGCVVARIITGPEAKFANMCLEEVNAVLDPAGDDFTEDEKVREHFNRQQHSFFDLLRKRPYMQHDPDLEFVFDLYEKSPFLSFAYFNILNLYDDQFYAQERHNLMRLFLKDEIEANKDLSIEKAVETYKAQFNQVMNDFFSGQTIEY